MRRRLQFPVSRYVLSAALLALVQAMTPEPAPEPEPVVVGMYL